MPQIPLLCIIILSFCFSFARADSPGARLHFSHPDQKENFSRDWVEDLVEVKVGPLVTYP